MAKEPKIRPCTKHLNSTYHHFWENVHVQNGDIQWATIRTEEQIANILMKPLADDLFQHVCNHLLNTVMPTAPTVCVMPLKQQPDSWL